MIMCDKSSIEFQIYKAKLYIKRFSQSNEVLEERNIHKKFNYVVKLKQRILSHKDRISYFKYHESNILSDLDNVTLYLFFEIPHICTCKK